MVTRGTVTNALTRVTGPASGALRSAPMQIAGMPTVSTHTADRGTAMRIARTCVAATLIAAIRSVATRIAAAFIVATRSAVITAAVDMRLLEVVRARGADGGCARSLAAVRNITLLPTGGTMDVRAARASAPWSSGRITSA